MQVNGSDEKDPSAGDGPKFGVIILNWNGMEDTLECLSSLKRNAYSNMELIVVDNASHDGSVTSIKGRFNDVTVIENKSNLGFCEGFNRGIEYALDRGAEYIACLNSDIIVDEHFIQELANAGSGINDLGALCPKEYQYYSCSVLNYAGGSIGIVRSKLFGNGEVDNGQYDTKRETGMLCGAAMVFKARALLDVGLFDPRYFYNTEDKDLAIRLLRKGYKLIFVPDAKIWHKGRGATGGKITPLTVYFSAKNNLLFVRLHGTCGEKFIFLPYYLLYHIPGLLLKCTDKLGAIKAITMAMSWHVFSFNKAGIGHVLEEGRE